VYTNVLALKTYLGITVDADDTLLTQLIRRAQGIIDDYCNRTFEASTDTTRYLDCPTAQGGRIFTDGQRRLNPPTLWLDRDLCQITSIINGDGTTITTGQYITQPVNGTPFYAIKLKSSSGINWTYTDDPEAAIAINGRWAWSVTAPQPIVYACERLSAYLYRKRDAQVFDDTAFAEGGVVRLPKGLPVDVVQILNMNIRTVTTA
jgi:hypothetical protein